MHLDGQVEALPAHRGEELTLLRHVLDLALCGLAYAGGKRGLGAIAYGRAETRLRYIRMLAEIPRFHRAARAVLDSADDGVTLGEVLARGGYSRYFVNHFALPLVSAVWSASEHLSRRYPARYLFAFLDRHGMLDIRSRLTWRTVYVDRIGTALPRVRTDNPVRAVRRHFDGVDVIDASGVTHAFDRVVIATHADQALSLLADPTPEERKILGAYNYYRNEASLHTDDRLLPAGSRAHASWNYLKPACHDNGGRILVSYHLNRLMRLSEPLDYLVTLNGSAVIDAAAQVATFTYEHPVYTPDALAAQRRLPALASTQTAYAGAYHGWGFHEDGCLSGVRAAETFGVTW